MACGGPFELGPGRGQIQYHASLFHPDAPNDVAPSGFNLPDPAPGLPAALIEETERMAAGLERPGVRLMEVDGDWSWSINSSVSPADMPRHLLG